MKHVMDKQKYEKLKNKAYTEYVQIKFVRCPHLKQNVHFTGKGFWHIVYRTLEFFGYIAVIDGWKIKVIVRKDGNGKPYFWSVIPNWVTNKKRDEKFLHYTGSLEED